MHKILGEKDFGRIGQQLRPGEKAISRALLQTRTEKNDLEAHNILLPLSPAFLVPFSLGGGSDSWAVLQILRHTHMMTENRQ